MKLPYQPEPVPQNIDMAKLRPNRSYGYRIENRNASLQDILGNKEKLKEWLKPRECPSCGGGSYWPAHHLTYFTPETLQDFLERIQGHPLGNHGIGPGGLGLAPQQQNGCRHIPEKFIEPLQFTGHGKNLRMYAMKI